MPSLTPVQAANVADKQHREGVAAGTGGAAPDPAAEPGRSVARNEAEMRYLTALAQTEGWHQLTREQCRAWIAAQRASGVLAPGCPEWRIVAATQTVAADIMAAVSTPPAPPASRQ